MSGLPREVLKWVQSLDLSYSIKNVKRDFCNGFLVAEIFNRYYKQDVQMHCFDNGISMNRRKDNWEQLDKFFKKKSIEILQSEVDEVIHCKDNAASDLVCKVYTILTGRVVKSVDPTPLDQNVPDFAKPTASLLVKQRMKAPDMQEGGDVKNSRNTATKVVLEHTAALRQGRTQGPPTIGSAPQPVRRGTTQKVEQQETGDSARVQFTKEVSVKQLEDNAALRSSRSSRTPRPAASRRAGGRTGQADYQSGEDALTIMDAEAQPFLTQGSEEKGTDSEQSSASASGRNHAIIRLVNGYGHVYDDAVVKRCFELLTQARAGELAASCLATPKNFWEFASVCSDVLVFAPAESGSFNAAIALLKEVGAAMLDADLDLPWSLFSDFALDKVGKVGRRHPNKRLALMEVVYSYCVPSPIEHVAALQKVEEIVNDSMTFLDCLSIFVTLEEEFTKAHVEFYSSHAIAGINQGGAVRPCGLAILAELAAHKEVGGHTHVVGFVEPVLSKLQTDRDWQVSMQISRICAAILQNLDASDAAVPSVVNLLVDRLQPSEQVESVCVALNSIAGIIGKHQAVRGIFTDVMVANAEARGRVLSVRSQPSQSITPIQSVWSQIAVAQGVVEHVQRIKAENLSAGHIDLLAASLEDIREFPAEEAEAWGAVFRSLRDFLLVELYDAHLAETVVYILRPFLFDPRLHTEGAKILRVSSNSDQKVPPLFGIMKLIFSQNGNEKCQKTLINFFQDLIAKQRDLYLVLIFNLVKNFAEHQQQRYASSPLLQDLMAQMERMTPNLK